MRPLLLWLQGLFRDSFSPSLQTLDIGYSPPSRKFRSPLTQLPKDRPGRVLPLPDKCGACDSYLLGYDPLNVVTCDNCDSLLSVSGHWHKPYGQILLTQEEVQRQEVSRKHEPA